MSNGYHVIVVRDHSSEQKSYHLTSFTIKALKVVVITVVTLLFVLIATWGFIGTKVYGYYEVSKENDSLRVITEQVDEVKLNYSKIYNDIKSLKFLSTVHSGAFLEDSIVQSDKELRKKRAVHVKEKNVPSILPLIGVVTQPFSSDETDPHNGVDFTASSGSVIMVTAGGTIVSTKYDKYLGKVVVVDHGNGLFTKYGHCSEILVKKGKTVERGEAIALVGSSGKSSGPHLHYQVIKDSIAVDPSSYY